MTTLGINMTDKEITTDWTNLHTSHPENELKVRALELYRLAGQLADEENPNWVQIHDLQEKARLLDKMAHETEDYENRQYAKAVMLEEGLP